MSVPKQPDLQRALGLPVWVFQAFVAILLLLKLGYSLVVPPRGDEAYYWLWGQHLELSYFDHAPFIGWAMAVSDRIFGWNLFALRAGNFVSLAGSAVILLHWARQLAPDDWQRAFWGSLAVYLASPLVFGITTIAYPDAWLMFFCLLSAHFFARAFTAQIDRGMVTPLNLYAGGIALGFAALSKYNAALFGVGVALAIVASLRLRPLLKSPHLYLAALASLAVLSPVVVWNASNEFISFRFQLYERHGSTWLSDINWPQFTHYAISLSLYASPFLLVPILRMMAKRVGTGELAGLQLLGRATLLASLVPISILALFVAGAPHWAISGLVVPAAIAIYFFWSRWLVLGHLVLGTLAGVVVVGYYMTYAFSNPGGDAEASRFYGWEQVGARMQQLAVEHGAATTLAGSRYEYISMVSWALRSTDVTSLSLARDEFDYWRDDAALAGQNIIILDERRQGTKPFEAIFESVEVLESFEVRLFGRELHSYPLLLGQNYRPAPDPRELAQQPE